MVVQHLFLTKQQDALYPKETKKADNCTRLPKDGLGRHMTDPELIETIQKIDKAKKDKAERKR